MGEIPQGLVKSLASQLAERRWSHEDIKLDCFTVHGETLSVSIQQSVYVRSHVGCGTLTGDGLTKYIQTNANI